MQNDIITQKNIFIQTEPSAKHSLFTEESENQKIKSPVNNDGTYVCIRETGK